MKKNSSRGSPQRAKACAKQVQARPGPETIGMDTGDKSSRYCVLSDQGEVQEEKPVATTKAGLTLAFARRKRCRIAIEVGAHSPWISRLLRSFGHEVYVANPRQLQLITRSSRKDDRLDARMLARLARVDPELLRPICHRGEQAQLDLMTIRVRAGLVEARTALVNCARGLAKSVGERLPECATSQWDEQRIVEAQIPAELRERLLPLIRQVAALNDEIRQCDLKIEQLARSEYPETELLKQVSGVGDLIALTFVLTLDDRRRFVKSRDVGCYVGLRPKRSESGESQPELHISKEGDVYLRKLLVQGAHYILGWRGPDTDLRRWGMKLAARGGKNQKKRAIVAVARKLAILLHRLWVTAEVYEPLRQANAIAAAKSPQAA